MIAALRNRIEGAYRPLIANASAVVGTTIVTSGLGAVYWLVAARLFTPAAVGLGAAAISAMMLLGAAGMLGFGTLLVGELRQRRTGQEPLIAAALIIVGPVGLLLGIGFALVAGRISPELQALAADPSRIALFALGVALAAITLVLDQALLGLLRGDLQFWRNAVFAATKLATLAAIGLWVTAGSGMAIYATWVVGGIASLGVFARAPGRHDGRVARRPRWSRLRELAPLALAHHGLNLVLQLPGTALPLVVTALLSAKVNAYFYTAWMIAGFVFVAPLALASALFAAGATSPNALRRQIRFTMGLGLIGGLLLNAFLIVGAGPVLRIAGSDYANQGEWPLRILALAVFPLIVKNHYVTLCRIQHRLYGAVARAGLGGMLELVLAAAGAAFAGLPGLSAGWLFALCIEALIMARPVYRIAMPDGRQARRPARPGHVRTSASNASGVPCLSGDDRTARVAIVPADGLAGTGSTRGVGSEGWPTGSRRARTDGPGP